MRNKKGFTLIELLAVIAVLGILIVFVVPKVIDIFNNSKRQSFLADVKSVYKAVNLKVLENEIDNSESEIYDSINEPIDINTKLEYKAIITDKKVTYICVSNGKYKLYSNTIDSADDITMNGVEEGTTCGVTENSFTVAYDCNGGTGTTESSTHLFHKASPLTANACSNVQSDNYSLAFRGWSTSSTATDPTYDNEENVVDLTSTVNGVINLYAVWEYSYTYTVAYSCNGGTGTVSSTAHRYNVSKALANNNCYKITEGTSGNIGAFKGWSTSSTATNPTYTGGQSVTNLTSTENGTVTLYAVWGNLFAYAGSYNVIADPSGSSNWKIKILSGSNTSFTLSAAVNIEAFLVGGGGGGADNYSWIGGGGGGGGYTTYASSINLSATSYSITIGSGGGVASNGVTTSGFGYSALGGYGATGQPGANGGSGGGAGGHNGSPSTGGNGGSYGGNGYNNARGNSSGGTGQGATVSTNSTCEFNQGTTSGCNAGVTAYAGGGGGGAGMSGGEAGTSGSAGAGCGGTNTGCGGRGGIGGTGGTQSGIAGIIVIRNKR